MAGRQLCPNCGATNLAEAEWCGQCYQRLGASTPEPAPLPTSAAAARTWRCRLCGETNALELDACSVCGTSVFDALGERSAKAPPQIALVSSIVPGLGLGRVGMPGEGVITALLVGFSLVGGAVIAAAGEPLSLLLVVGGVALWAVSARDAFVVAGSDRSAAWLQARTLTIVAVLVLILTAAALLRAIPTRGRS